MIVAIGSDGKTRTYKGNSSKELNYALSHGGVVKLDKGIVYNILDSLMFVSFTTLEGNGAILKLSKGLPIWGGRNVSISQEKAMLMLSGNSASSITIKDITVDGSQSDYYPNVKLGTSCYNMATLIGGNGITIKNCLFKNGCNDAMLFNKCKNVSIDAITVNKCGHDGIYAYYVDKISVTNSSFINRTNSSIRLYNVTGGKCTKNNMTTSGGGFTGVELQGNLKDVTISENYIKNLPYPAIVSLGAKMSNVLITKNTIENCRSPYISASGATVTNNIIR